ncbi:MAG: hypothetical protein H6553_02680 [Chitinophagales bacterium]|nr:hypothetical protein [Chitinophagales bacterium]
MEEEKDISIQKSQLQRVVEGFLRVTGLADWVSYAQVLKNAFFVILFLGIGLIEIFNTHLAERMSRKITVQKENIKELRWEYMTEKADFNYKTKQSEMQKLLAPYGINAAIEPPKKIEYIKE